MAYYLVPQQVIRAQRRRQAAYSTGQHGYHLDGVITGVASLNSLPQPNIVLSVFHRESKAFVKDVLTNELGEYTISGLNKNGTYDIIARGLVYGKNDKIRSNVVPS
jgi:hypothetical protein